MNPTTLDVVEQMKVWSRTGLGSFIESNDRENGNNLNDVTLTEFERVFKDLDKGVVSSINKKRGDYDYDDIV